MVTTSAWCLIWLCCGGCVTSSLRYTRSVPSTDIKNSPRKIVPATWDYRTTYALPADRLAEVANKYIGIRYRFGGMSRKGTDCSGLVCMIYKDVSHAKLPHSSRRQRQLGRVVSIAQAKSGDLVFFKGGLFGGVGHVGIYLENSTFIHASTKKGVICSTLQEPYYKQRFVDIRRIFK